MRIILFIASFGALGCTTRYLLAGWVSGLFGGRMPYPYGTFAVNVLGAFLIGVVMELSLRGAVSQELRIGLTAGFLGGFTTFSAFSYETFRLVEDGLFAQAMLYIFASVAVCVAFTIAGIALCRSL